MGQVNTNTGKRVGGFTRPTQAEYARQVEEWRRERIERATARIVAETGANEADARAYATDFVYAQDFAD